MAASTRNLSQEIVALVGRALIAQIFLGSGISKFLKPEETAQYVASKNLPMAALGSKAAAVTEIIGGSLILLGHRPRVAATGLFTYLIPTTFLFHDFWKQEGMVRQIEQTNFMKNLAILGGLLTLVARGSGRISLTGKTYGVPLLEDSLFQNLRQELPRFRRAA
jgi:putative oxidoreductase